MSLLDHLSETAKHWIDALSLGALVATLINALPAITAILVAVWTIARLYETYLAIRLKHRELARKE